MIRNIKIFNCRKIYTFSNIKNNNFKEEYMNIPTIYLLGIPLCFGLGMYNLKFLNNPISYNDKLLGNYYRDSIFWSPQ
jgi:hypothetical protein